MSREGEWEAFKLRTTPTGGPKHAEASILLFYLSGRCSMDVRPQPCQVPPAAFMRKRSDACRHRIVKIYYTAKQGQIGGGHRPCYADSSQEQVNCSIHKTRIDQAEGRCRAHRDHTNRWRFKKCWIRLSGN